MYHPLTYAMDLISLLTRRVFPFLHSPVSNLFSMIINCLCFCSEIVLVLFATFSIFYADIWFCRNSEYIGPVHKPSFKCAHTCKPSTLGRTCGSSSCTCNHKRPFCLCACNWLTSSLLYWGSFYVRGRTFYGHYQPILKFFYYSGWVKRSAAWTSIMRGWRT